MKKLLILFLITFLSFSSTHGQELRAATDYIVLGDTIQKTGVIVFSKKSKEVKFKPKFSSTYYTYSIENVSEFKYQNIKYFRKKLPEGLFFAKKLADGDVTLYQTDDFFILEKGSVSQAMTESNYEEILNEVYQDKCEWQYNKKMLQYQKALLEALVNGYSKKECYKTPKRGVTVSIGVGQIKSSIKVDAHPSIIKSLEHESVSVVGGVTKEIPLYNGSSFLIDVGVISHQFPEENLRLNQDVFDLKKSTTYLTFTPMLRWYLGDFFVNPGAGVAFSILDDSKFQAESSDANVPSDFNISKLLLGYKVGIGYRLIENDSFSLSVQLQHQNYGNSGVGVSSNSFLISIGK